MIKEMVALFLFLLISFFVWMEVKVQDAYDIQLGQECIAAYQADLDYHKQHYKGTDDLMRRAVLTSRVHELWRQGLGPDSWWSCVNTAFTGVTNMDTDSIVDPWPIGRVR